MLEKVPTGKPTFLFICDPILWKEQTEVRAGEVSSDRQNKMLQVTQSTNISPSFFLFGQNLWFD